MFVEDWDSFYQQAENLYQSNPLSTRYVMKYTHSSGKLVLKVTDDRVVRVQFLKSFLFGQIFTVKSDII